MFYIFFIDRNNEMKTREKINKIATRNISTQHNSNIQLTNNSKFLEQNENISELT
jgi:hypothetical protein